MERLDAERLETLSNWAAGLVADERPELRAAGKAIQMLVEEIELLNMDLWHLRGVAGAVEAEAAPTEKAPDDVALTLRGRVGRLVSGRTQRA